MKKTTREFGVCWNCKGKGGRPTKPTDESDVNWILCEICHGKKHILIKETVEESDDMKEFIEKKCGWVLMEPVKEVSWRKITFN